MAYSADVNFPEEDVMYKGMHRYLPPSESSSVLHS